MLRVLFVCARNQWRSPTAAAIFKNHPGLDVRSAGLSSQSPCVLSAKLLAWADLVLVMEHDHSVRIRDRFRGQVDLPEIISLDIPDDYTRMDPELIRILRESVHPLLEEFLDEGESWPADTE